MLNKLRSNQGFTLIELLIVVAIIGILAAIAIPQFSKYRIQGFNSSANSDMRNCRTSQESLYAEYQSYGQTVSVVTANPLAWPGGVGGGVAVNVPAIVANTNGITTNDNAGIARGLQIAVGNNISICAKNQAAVAPALTSPSFTLAAKHVQGDTAYGADSDSTSNFKRPTLPGAVTPNLMVGYVLADTDVPPPTNPATDFAAPWLAM